MRIITLACALLLASASLCRADSLAGPSPRVFASEDGDKVLKIVPGLATPAIGATAGAAAAIARATWMRLDQNGDEILSESFPLVNMPMRALIPERRVDGFVTLDSSSSPGRQHAVVLYKRSGQVVRDFALEDLLSAQEIADHTESGAGSASARAWRRDASFRFEVPERKPEPKAAEPEFIFAQPRDNSLPAEARLVIDFSWGKQVRIKLANGEILPAK